MSLSVDQRNAATRRGQDVCVVAGPGSGKTRVLIARFLWLAQQQGVPPDRVLAITFTEKAATEIKMRLVGALEDSSTLRQQIERAYVSTIHGFCARLLKENAIAAGVDIDFTVLDEPQSQALLAESADEALDGILLERRPAILELLESLYVSSSAMSRNLNLAGALISVYEAMRVAGVALRGATHSQPHAKAVPFSDLRDAVRTMVDWPTEWNTANRREKRELLLDWLSEVDRVPDAPISAVHFKALAQFPKNLGQPTTRVREELKRVREELMPSVRAHISDVYFGSLKDLLTEAIERLDAAYRVKKRVRAGLDFSDLEEGALQLLTTMPAVRDKVREQFEYILMDELQDTNRLQWKILDLIRRPNRFFGVGDINQSIYGFRHADPEVFREYRDGLEANSKVIDRLRENHRSRPEILSTVGAMFTGAPGIEEHRLDPQAVFAAKTIPSVEVIAVGAATTEAAEENEALWIARRIYDLQQSMGVPFSAFAILGRKSSVLERVERGLRQFQIPALVVGGRTLMESREVRDVVAFLRVVANTRDEISLAGVLRSPLAGIRDETLLRLKQAGYLWPNIAALDPRTSTIDGADLEQLLWFRELLSEVRSRRDAVSTDRLAARILDETGYQVGLDSQGRRNLARFLSLLRDLYEREPRPPAEVLDELDQLRDAEFLAEAPPAEAANAVRLMTVHAAKGLEFPVVFIASMHQKTQEDTNPIAFSPRHGLGVRWRDPFTQKAAEDSSYAALDAEIERRNKEEEMRLLYVAMTRAKDHLVLSYSSAGQRSRWSSLVGSKLMIESGDAEEDSVRLLDEVPVRVIRSAQAPVASHASSAEAQEIVPLPLSKPALVAQNDSGAPVTALGVFVACPRRYYLGHYLGFSENRPEAVVNGSQSPQAVDVGIQVHQILAGVPIESPSTEAIQLAESFRLSPLAQRIERSVRVEREFDFVMELEELVVRGQIDLWFEEGGQLVLVDYKTDRWDPVEEPQRLQSYALQLQLYAIALEKLTGRPPDQALLCFLRANQVIPVAVDEPSVAAARTTLRQFRDAQEKVVFPLMEGEQCLRCGFYRGLCPAGRAMNTAYASQPSSCEDGP